MNKSSLARAIIFLTFFLFVTSSFGFADNTPWSTTGDIGIGTTTAHTKLHLYSQSETVPLLRLQAYSVPILQFKRSNSTFGNGQIQWIGSDESVTWSILANQDGGGDNFNIREGLESRLYINDKHVGLGTTWTPEDLTIQSENNTPCGILIRHAASDGAGHGWKFATTGTATNDLIISSQWNAENTERLRIKENGNVGIGTTTPHSQLEVFGDSIFGNGVYQDIKLHGTPTNSYGYNGVMEVTPNSCPGSGIATFATYFKSAGNSSFGTRHDIIVDGNLTLGTGTYKNIVLQQGTNLNGYNGVFEMAPLTTPGSGVARYSTRFKSAGNTSNGPGTIHDVIVDGGLVIGATSISTGFKLDVAGSIKAKEIRVLAVNTDDINAAGLIAAKEININNAAWSDFVFEDGYKLPSLDKVEAFVKENKHLPEIPSAEQIAKEGLPMAEMMAKQMQKIEELTLYVIELEKKNRELETRSARLNDIEARLKALEEKK